VCTHWWFFFCHHILTSNKHSSSDGLIDVSQNYIE
jgi:hypothetical protein